MLVCVLSSSAAAATEAASSSATYTYMQMIGLGLFHKEHEHIAHYIFSYASYNDIFTHHTHAHTQFYSLFSNFDMILQVRCCHEKKNLLEPMTAGFKELKCRFNLLLAHP